LPLSGTTAELLKAHAMLKGFAESMITPLAEAGQVRSFQIGDPIFQAGMPNEGVYFIISGEVRVFLMHNHGEESFGTLGPGEVLGDLALSAPDKHVANVTAEKVTLVVFLPLAKIEEMRQDKPGVIAQLALRLGRRFALSARSLNVEALFA
jgi:CRP-like cAMP-binding protein